VGQQNGQSLVEIAILLPLFILVWWLLVETGLAYGALFGLENSVRELGRWGARGDDYFKSRLTGEGGTLFARAATMGFEEGSDNALCVTYVTIGQEGDRAAFVEKSQARIGILPAEPPPIDVQALVETHQAIIDLRGGKPVNDMIAIYVDGWHRHDLLMRVFGFDHLNLQARSFFRVTYQRELEL
jgi:hypothetical protein